MTVSPEHGKLYKTRNGHIVGPMHVPPIVDCKPIVVASFGRLGWCGNGRYMSDGGLHALDLMSEYTTCPAEPAWIEWNGGECPIKSDKTLGRIKLRDGLESESAHRLLNCRWNHNGNGGDIIAYRITEDHEPKMTQTREQIKAQIEALQKQLDAMPVARRGYWNGSLITNSQHPTDTHYFDIETINGVPHIHGVAMKELAK